ncbi:MAG: 50S ribosomal protein L29 [Candidatus Kerfeldbacteria bacterium]|nr:50S ribosomal protein L29 [Candidatus Kerfeldbacteria bacterium]
MPKRRDAINELRAYGLPELEKQLAAAREDLRDLRFRVAANQHKDVRAIRELRTRVARLLTLIQTRRSSPQS